MEHEDLYIGMHVLYAPIAGQGDAYVGVVAAPPRLLGAKWVVELSGMDAAYRAQHGRTCVRAAAVAHLTCAGCGGIGWYVALPGDVIAVCPECRPAAGDR